MGLCVEGAEISLPVDSQSLFPRVNGIDIKFPYYVSRNALYSV